MYIDHGGHVCLVSKVVLYCNPIAMGASLIDIHHLVLLVLLLFVMLVAALVVFWWQWCCFVCCCCFRTNPYTFALGIAAQAKSLANHTISVPLRQTL
jgi:hypothetical protein